MKNNIAPVHLEKKLLPILENIPLGLVLINLEGKIDWVNETALQIMPASPNKDLSVKAEDIWPVLVSSIRACLENAHHAYDHEIKHEGGHVMIDLLPLSFINQEKGALLIVKPAAWISGKIVEEQKKLAKVNEEMELILNSSFDGIWICDREGTVQCINHSSEKINNIRSEQVVGRKMEELVLEGVVDRSVTLAVIKSGKPETFIQHLQSGKKLLATGNPVFDSSGKLSWVVVNERDITELNQLRTELEESRKLIQDYQTEIDFLTTQEEIFSPAIIRNDEMSRVFQMAMKAAKVGSTVLLQGEAGVGKGKFAKQIHHASNRQENPFIHIDCSSIPEVLIEQELFGYAQGKKGENAFQNQAGLIEMANESTLFLDEIDQLPLFTQAKLFRFLEDQEIVREGSKESKKIDVRVIAATCRDLEELVRQNQFRQDLFLKLNVISIHIPPLRERIEDIPPLIELYLEKFNKKCGAAKSIDAYAMDCLCKYHFPGNIRELTNMMEQLVVFVANDRIQLKDLPFHVRKKDASQNLTFGKKGLRLQEAVENLEKTMIRETLQIYSNQKHAAAALGVDQSTLSRKIKKYKIAF